MKFKVGDKVTFDDKVYWHPFAPYYDAYKGHTFEVEAVYTEEPYGAPWAPHIKLKCVDDPNIKVNGHVHPEDLNAAN